MAAKTRLPGNESRRAHYRNYRQSQRPPLGQRSEPRGLFPRSRRASTQPTFCEPLTAINRCRGLFLLGTRFGGFPMDSRCQTAEPEAGPLGFGIVDDRRVRSQKAVTEERVGG